MISFICLPPASTHDQGVFSFYGDGRPCAGIPEALLRYREIAATVQLSGSIILTLISARERLVL